MPVRRTLIAFGIAILGLAASPSVLSESSMRVLSDLAGIPYRVDGAVDERGRFTLFADMRRTFDTPGLNCSGFVVEAARRLFGRPLPLPETIRDRLDDSGPFSPYGQDWDFGWDLILNVSDGMERRMWLPGGYAIDPDGATGREPRGFDLHSEESWGEILERVKPGHVYLLSFNKAVRGNRLYHYHVGLLYPSGKEDVWFWHTSRESGHVTRRNLRDETVRQQILRGFANTANVRKHIVVIEVALP